MYSAPASRMTEPVDLLGFGPHPHDLEQLVESRDAQFGAHAGVPFAEGFVVRDPIVLPDVLS
jgi:hypothetical protein